MGKLDNSFLIIFQFMIFSCNYQLDLIYEKFDRILFKKRKKRIMVMLKDILPNSTLKSKQP